MGKPLWPNGKPIRGVEIRAHHGELPLEIIADFDLPPPEDESQVANADLLSAVHQEYDFLPAIPKMIRQSDLLEIDACLAFSHTLIRASGYQGDIARQLTLALGCVCFNDARLFDAAISLDYEDSEAVKRFKTAVESIATEASI